MLSKKLFSEIGCLLFLFALPIVSQNALAKSPGCTAKIKADTDRMIWGGVILPYSTNIHFGAQRTQGVIDGPELTTRRGTSIPRVVLYDIAPECNALREWDGDPYYFHKWNAY